jgi:L-ascorbate metabolism protein UlaG (beta-lactamase superfamily)
VRISGLKTTKLLWAFCAGLVCAQDLRIEPTYNAGASLQCGAARVYADTFFVGLDGYQKPPADAIEKLLATRGPLLALATHAHRDHWDLETVARLLTRNPKAAFWGTAQTAGELAKRFPKQVKVLAVEGQARWGEVTLEYFALPHSGERWKTLENSAIVINICGRRILHPGDADLVPERFARIGRVDAALLPYWYYLSPEGLRLLREQLRPQAAWALHGDWNDRSWIERVRAAYPSARIPSAFLKR